MCQSTSAFLKPVTHHFITWVTGYGEHTGSENKSVGGEITCNYPRIDPKLSNICHVKCGMSMWTWHKNCVKVSDGRESSRESTWQWREYISSRIKKDEDRVKSDVTLNLWWATSLWISSLGPSCVTWTNDIHSNKYKVVRWNTKKQKHEKTPKEQETKNTLWLSIRIFRWRTWVYLTTQLHSLIGCVGEHDARLLETWYEREGDGCIGWWVSLQGSLGVGSNLHPCITSQTSQTFQSYV